MSDTRFRIPRMTMAVMVFGGLGCGSDKKSGSTTESDTARIQKIADDECTAQFTCPDANSDYATQQECVDHYVNKLTTELAKVTTGCREASLEYYECYETLGCGGDPAQCAKQNVTYEAKCQGMLPATTS